MAYINVTISIPNRNVTQLNQILYNDSTKPDEGIEILRNLLSGINGGEVNAELEVVVRDTDPAVAPAGGGVSRDYKKL